MLLPLVNTAQQYLFVIDGANQLVQRCRMHKLRNVVERLPQHDKMLHSQR